MYNHIQETKTFIVSQWIARASVDERYRLPCRKQAVTLEVTKRLEVTLAQWVAGDKVTKRVARFSVQWKWKSVI